MNVRCFALAAAALYGRFGFVVAWHVVRTFPLSSIRCDVLNPPPGGGRFPLAANYTGKNVKFLVSFHLFHSIFILGRDLKDCCRTTYCCALFATTTFTCRCIAFVLYRTHAATTRIPLPRITHNAFMAAFKNIALRTLLWHALTTLP